MNPTQPFTKEVEHLFVMTVGDPKRKAPYRGLFKSKDKAGRRNDPPQAMVSGPSSSSRQGGTPELRTSDAPSPGPQ
jgi:hypothetical protein